jgi:hypothetical protein
MSAPPITVLQDNRIKITNRGRTRIVVGGAVATPSAGVDVPETDPITAATYTLDRTLSGVWHLFNADPDTGCEVTIPLNLSRTSYYPCIQADGSGVLTIVPADGVTLLNKLNHTQVSTGPGRFEIAPGGLNIWHLNGDTE